MRMSRRPFPHLDAAGIIFSQEVEFAWEAEFTSEA